MHAEAHRRPSTQSRTDHPVPAEQPHPRALEIADAIRNIQALGQGVSFGDLKRAGFSERDISLHFEAADEIVTKTAVKQLSIAPDLLADMVAKARAPMPNDPPMPQHVGETQALYLAWGHYCAARQALRLDPWSGQRKTILREAAKAMQTVLN